MCGECLFDMCANCIERDCVGFWCDEPYVNCVTPLGVWHTCNTQISNCWKVSQGVFHSLRPHILSAGDDEVTLSTFDV